MHAATADAARETAVERPVAPHRWPEPIWITRAADERGWKWARIAWNRAAGVDGAWFDAAKADAIVAIWPKIMRLTDDRFAGHPFHLLAWQEIILRMLVGWKRPIEAADPATGRMTQVQVRLFRRLRMWVPRKNGKTETLAAFGKLFFCHERVIGAQGFAFAKDEKQGRIVFDKIKAMIAYDPSLKDRQIEAYKKDIYLPDTRSVFELLPGKAEGKHGRSPTVIVGDEMHEWESRALADTLRQGTGARLQWIELFASTAGLADAGAGVELYAESQDILDGVIDDATTLVAIFALDAEDDPFDEANWPKANPSLGYSLTLDALRGEAALARGNPRREAWFRCYHMGQWIDSDVAWLPKAKWDACAGARDWKTRRDKLRGRPARTAFDVSSTQDVFAKIDRIEIEDGPPQLVCRFWVPEATFRARADQDKRTPWDMWRETGAIEVTPGEVVDQDFVRRALDDDLAWYDYPERQAIGFDPWNATKLVNDMIKAGAPETAFVQVRQGHLTLGAPSAEFERRVFAREIDHGGHPVLRWMARNTVVLFDENLNFRPSKKRSKDKIDGIVAAVMAEALAMTKEVQGPGVY